MSNSINIHLVFLSLLGADRLFEKMVSPFTYQLNLFVLLELLPLDKLDISLAVVFLNKVFNFTKSDFILCQMEESIQNCD